MSKVYALSMGDNKVYVDGDRGVSNITISKAPGEGDIEPHGIDC